MDVKRVKAQSKGVCRASCNQSLLPNAHAKRIESNLNLVKRQFYHHFLYISLQKIKKKDKKKLNLPQLC